MRDVVQFLIEFILALTGALAAGAFVVGGIAFAVGCAVCGCGWWWRGRRRKAAGRKQDEMP